MALTAAGISYGAVNLDDASSCRGQARNLRHDAGVRRQTINELRYKISSLERQMGQSTNKVVQLESEIGNYFVTHRFKYSVYTIRKNCLPWLG